MGENVRDREPQSKQRASPGCGHYVRWSYQALPPAEQQPSFPLLSLPGAPKTWAFISRAKYPRSLQSLSFLALRQSDNYLFSFPLLLASREVFWLALVCMKYYQNIAHFSILQPLTQEIWSHRSCDWQVSVFHVPLRITALFWSYSRNFDGRRNECVMCIKALLLCLTSVCHYFWTVLLCLTLLFLTQSLGVKVCRFSEFKLMSEFPPQKNDQRYYKVTSPPLRICRDLGDRQMSMWHIMPGRGRHLAWLWSVLWSEGQEFHPAAHIPFHIIHSYQ